jgi:NMD protein affecting ribosome stability and mRNA decay
MAKIRFKSEPITDENYQVDRYLDQCIHRKNKKLIKQRKILFYFLTTSIVANLIQFLIH